MQNFFNELFENFSSHITDQVFLTIQNDRNLMYQYLRLVEAQGLDNVNRSIGREISRHFNLTNAQDRNRQPLSTLIQSHQIFEEDIQ